MMDALKKTFLIATLILTGLVFNANAQFVADFIVIDTLGCAPYTIQFNDTSSGNPDAWLWSFGDTMPPSTQQHPTFVYDYPGRYTVSLIIFSNGVAVDTMVKTNYIKVEGFPGPLNLNIPATVTNPSCALNGGSIDLFPTGNPYSGLTYLWSDGTTNEDLSGAIAATYTVTITDANGCTAFDYYNLSYIGPNFTIGTTNTTCPTCNDGIAQIDVTNFRCLAGWSYTITGGGATHYSTSGTDTIHSVTLITLPQGTYQINYSDQCGCTTIVDSFAVGLTCFSVSETIQAANCGVNLGSISLSVSGGTSPYNYLWSNGAITEDILNLTTGTYTVTITDFSQCVEVFDYFVADSTDLMASAGGRINQCSPSPLTLGGNPTASGGTPPYTYLWSTGDTSSSINVNPQQTTTYGLTVTDATGCTTTSNAEISIGSGNIGGVRIVIDTILSTECDSIILRADVNPVFGPFDYEWNINFSRFRPAVGIYEPGTYRVTITNSYGCTAVDSLEILPNQFNFDCIWPGDADHDGYADNNDVLAIGVGYGITGSTRPNASLFWNGQQAPDWNLALPTGVNLKHTDCNGDGVINSSDTLAISQNYGLVHYKNGQKNGVQFVDPPLTYTLPSDTALAGMSLIADVNLGDQSFPATNIYGIVFSVEYDNTLIEPGSIGFMANDSWMGTLGQNILDFDIDRPGQSKLDVTVTRIDQNNVSGFGKLGEVTFVMKDDISGKNDIIKAVNFDFSNVKLIDVDMTETPVFYEDATMHVSQWPLGVGVIDESKIALYPNPANNRLILETGGDVNSWSIIDMFGKELISSDKPKTIEAIDVSDLNSGIYFIRLNAEGYSTLKRFTIIK